MADIFQLPPPKACAKCKNRYWNKAPRRQLKPITNLKDPNSKTYPRIAVTRLKAMMRQQKQLIVKTRQLRKRFRELKRDQPPLPQPILIPVTGKKKKKLIA